MRYLAELVGGVVLLLVFAAGMRQVAAYSRPKGEKPTK